MRDKLPVCIENRKLPDEGINKEKGISYGYVSVLYLASLLITIISLLSVIIVWNR